MSPLLRIRTAKDRMKLRFVLAELADVKRDKARCQRGSDAWAALSSYSVAINRTCAEIVQRLRWAGIEYPQPMGVVEAGAICAAAAASLIALLAVAFSMAPS